MFLLAFDVVLVVVVVAVLTDDAAVNEETPRGHCGSHNDDAVLLQ